MGAIIHPFPPTKIPVSHTPLSLETVQYAPACGVCRPLAFLVYEGNHQMHCPACGQVYSCLTPPENYLSILDKPKMEYTK